MKLSVLRGFTFGLLIISASGCESQAGLYMQYYFTPEGWRAQKAIKQLNTAVGHDDWEKAHSSAATPASPVDAVAPSKPATEEVAYLQSASLKQGFTSAMADLSADDKTASDRGQKVLELLMKSALATAGSDTVNWNTARLQKYFGKVTGTEKLWGQNPTVTVQKNGPLHYSIITIKKPDTTTPLSLHYTTQSDDVCRTADAVLKTQDKLGMEMVAKNGDKKTLPHPFGGKPCAKGDLQRNFKSFALSIETDTVRGSATPELAVLWKNDPKDTSIWFVHYRASAAAEKTDLMHALEKIL